MPIRFKKDKEKLVGTLRLRLSYHTKHYVDVYLWEDRKSMLENTNEESPNTVAMFCPRPWKEHLRYGKKVFPKLGEIHFVCKDWNEEIVAHEVQHAIIHRIRVLTPIWEHIERYEYNENGEICEEEICLDAGRWVSQVFSWLWDTDPFGEYKERLLIKEELVQGIF